MTSRILVILEEESLDETLSVPVIFNSVIVSQNEIVFYITKTWYNIFLQIGLFDLNLVVTTKWLCNLIPCHDVSTFVTYTYLFY